MGHPVSIFSGNWMICLFLKFILAKSFFLCYISIYSFIIIMPEQCTPCTFIKFIFYIWWFKNVCFVITRLFWNRINRKTIIIDSKKRFKILKLIRNYHSFSKKYISKKMIKKLFKKNNQDLKLYNIYSFPIIHLNNFAKNI